MTDIVYYSEGNTYFNTNSGRIQYSSFVSSSPSEYIYTNAYGNRVTMTGTDIVVDGSGRFVSGTLNKIEISPYNGNTNDVGFEINNLSLDGREVLGSGGSNVPTNDYSWAAILEGDVSLEATGTQALNMALDGYGISGSAIAYGGDNEMSGAFHDKSYISGSFNSIRDTAKVIAGDFEFEGEIAYLNGDASYVYNNGLLKGGDDTLVWDMKTQDNYFEDWVAYWSGDANSAAYTSTVIGGDDMIDMRDYVTARHTSLSGDVRSARDSATVIGGDDVIYGATKSANYIYGDVESVSAIHNFVGGDDILRGGAKNDYIYGDVGSAKYTGQGGGDDSIFGGNGNDYLVGNGGNDYFRDGYGAGRIYGGNGRDTLEATLNGAHTFYGGSGSDTVSYDRSTQGVTIDLQAGTSEGGWAENDTLVSVENVIGSRGIDRIFGNDDNNLIRSGDASDRVAARGGNDTVKTGGGNDRIDAGSGANHYEGGKGFDILSYRDSNAAVNINLEAKTASGGYANNDTIRSIEHIFGSDFDDTIWGDKKDNILRGYEGDDQLTGRAGVDVLEGGRGEDGLSGGSDADRLFGGADDDWLDGGHGNDLLTGGQGEDTFHFDRWEDKDRIRDFENDVDTIELDGFGRNYDAFARARKVGDDVHFDFGGGDYLIVEDTTIGELRNDLEIV